MDAIVWVADDQVSVGQDYGVRLVERLAARGLRVERRELTRANCHIPAAELHVLSGGGTSVWDESSWMPRGLGLTRALLDGADRGEHTVFGVCLGSQMIAETLWPGSVGNGKRMQAGLAEVAWRPIATAPDEWLVVPVFHYEQVSRERAVAGGATIVAESRRSVLQGFRLGRRVWGVQFHPELEPADVRRLVAHHRPTIEKYRSSAEAALASVDQLEPAWNPHLFDRILDQVADGALRR